MKKIQVLLFLFAPVIFIAAFLIGKGTYSEAEDLFYTVFPPKYETSMDILNVKIGDIEYAIPKAYFYNSLPNTKDDIRQISIFASNSNNFIPWSLSEGFNKKNKDSLVKINIDGQLSKSDALSFPMATIENNNNLYKKRYNGLYGSPDKKIYKSIFRRYDGIRGEYGPISFYLIPEIETKNSYLIECPVQENKESTSCIINSLYSNGSLYSFNILLSHLPNFLELDKKVRELIDTLAITQESI